MPTVVLAGCGRVAQKHLRAIQDLPDFKLIGVIDSHPERARALLEKVMGRASAIPIYASPQAYDAGNNPRPDVVAIAATSGAHYDLACWALDQDAAVVLEKPMTLKVAQALDLYQRSLTSGQPLVMGHIYRYFPAIHDLKKAIAEGAYGTLLYAQAKVFWGHDSTYYQGVRGTWAADGGALLNQTIHALDLLLYLTGIEPTHWSAQLRRAVHQQIEAEDLGVAQGFSQTHPALFQLVGTTASDPACPAADFDLVFTHGRLQASLDRGRPSLRIKGHPGRLVFLKKLIGEVLGKGDASASASGPSSSRRLRFKALLHPHHGIYLDLARALQTGQPPRADAACGYRSVLHLLSLYASGRAGGAVQAVENLPADFSTLDLQGWQPPVQTQPVGSMDRA